MFTENLCKLLYWFDKACLQIIEHRHTIDKMEN